MSRFRPAMAMCAPRTGCSGLMGRPVSGSRRRWMSSENQFMSSNRADAAFAKDTTGFIQLPGALEPPLETQDGYITPNERFFVCSAGTPPAVDLDQWSLTVGGDGVTQAITLDYQSLKAMPQVDLPALLECAGNHRILFEEVSGEVLNRRPNMTEVRWGRGAIGMAVWSGVRLRDVLLAAGIREDAYHVCPVGLDRGYEGEDGIKVPLPVQKAMHPDTLIALGMNGAPLPDDHGFPARLIVPGWVGTYSIKWLDRFDVTRTHQWVYRNTELYVLSGDAYPKPEGSPAKGIGITEQTIKSALALSWPANLPAGRHRLFGYAHSPGAEIASVEWSVDGGAIWSSADILSENRKWAWGRFAFDWQAAPGRHAIRTRTTDRAGRTQPDRIPFNDGGYLFNKSHEHPVHVRHAAIAGPDE
ncbi:MAG: molybdopterin-dependent oxidoreductase [Boseongicola sp. SB0667_bin_21]|nr:molybdopterin-dependent oxidoreductase [Boseongicola sp. SB0667_bin_21]